MGGESTMRTLLMMRRTGCGGRGVAQEKNTVDAFMYMRWQTANMAVGGIGQGSLPTQQQVLPHLYMLSSLDALS